MKPPSLQQQACLPYLHVRIRCFTAILTALLAMCLSTGTHAADTGKPATTAKAALAVTITRAQSETWPSVLSASGNIAAWQEASIGAELSGYRLTEVLVNVGETVKKGQLLARISDETLSAEAAHSQAAVQEAEATLGEARANATRARQLESAGFYSPQLASQAITAAQTAKARLEAARARHRADRLRLQHTQVRAPDAGTISARNATVGEAIQPGQELFRLIRGNRLEWRAEVTETELGQLKPGMTAVLSTPGGATVQGHLRMLAPTVNPQTRYALVYVDLPASALAAGMRAGMFARGSFDLGRSRALTLPQTAVLLRDGFAYVFRLGKDSKVIQTKIRTGRRVGERIEVLDGLNSQAQVVSTGAGFLADGDTVRVVTPPAASPRR